MSATLKFNVVDADPATHEADDPTDEGYEDEYELEDVELELRDYMQKVRRIFLPFLFVFFLYFCVGVLSQLPGAMGSCWRCQREQAGAEPGKVF